MHAGVGVMGKDSDGRGGGQLRSHQYAPDYRVASIPVLVVGISFFLRETKIKF